MKLLSTEILFIIPLRPCLQQILYRCWGEECLKNRNGYIHIRYSCKKYVKIDHKIIYVLEKIDLRKGIFTIYLNLEKLFYLT